MSVCWAGGGGLGVSVRWAGGVSVGRAGCM